MNNWGAADFPITPEASAAFWARVERQGDCLIWKGATSGAKYGKFIFRRQHCKAHRFAYREMKGAIPAGLVIDHLCRAPKCVNPFHLEAVTQQVNTLRQVRPPFCRKGHLYDVQVKDGRTVRRCLTCNRAKEALNRASYLASRDISGRKEAPVALAR